VADLGERPRETGLPLILRKRRRNNRRMKSRQGKRNKAGPLLTSRSGSATELGELLSVY